MTALCPRCRKPLAVPLAVTSVRCESCGARFKVTRAIDAPQSPATGPQDAPPAEDAPATGAELRPQSRRRTIAPMLFAAGGAVAGSALVFLFLSLLGWRPPRGAKVAVVAVPSANAPNSQPASNPPRLVVSTGGVRATPDFVSATGVGEVTAGARAATQPAIAVATTRPAAPPVVAATQSAAATQPAAARRPPRPPLQPMAIPSPDRVSDAAVEGAIRRGVEVLIAGFDPESHVLTNVGKNPDALACGLNALCVYALL
jgi:hypothetical protein